MANQTIDTHRNRRRTLVLVAAGLTAVAAIAALTLGTQPSAADDPDPIEASLMTPLAEFTDDVSVQVREKPDGRHREVVNLRDASDIAVVKVTIQPGATFPWHTHPGLAVGVITDGASNGGNGEPPFVYIYENCDRYAYEVGEAFIDPGFGNVHTATNPSDEVTTVIVTFIGIEDTPLTQPIFDHTQEEENDAQNEACGTEAPLPPEPED
jgi:predicted metal-dependent enzyme (double-stranded beta helix superfamily)